MNFNIDDFLPYKLSLVTNTVSQSLAKQYEAFNITRTQWRILAVLGAGDAMSAQAIANKTMMDKTTLSRAIKKLCARGLVDRKTAQDDGRALLLNLSIAGMEIYAEILPLVLKQGQQVFKDLSKSDLKTLERILNALI